MFGSFASRAFEVSCSFQGSLRRVCVPEMTWQNVIFGWPRCRRLRLDRTEECGRSRMSPDSYRQLLPQTEQFPACSWFGVCSSQWLVAHGPTFVDLEFVARENDRPYNLTAMSTRTAILLRPNAPSRRTCTQFHDHQQLRCVLLEWI